MRTHSKNLKLYRHFYGFEYPQDIDTTKLAKKLKVSQQKIAGLLRSAQNDTSVTTALILKGEQPPHWFAQPEPRHTDQRSGRSSTTRNAQPPLQPTGNPASQLDIDSLSRIMRLAALSAPSATPDLSSTGPQVLNSITGEMIPLIHENPREISPWEKVFETLRQTYQVNMMQEFMDAQEHRNAMRRAMRTPPQQHMQLPPPQHSILFQKMLTGMMHSIIQQDREQKRVHAPQPAPYVFKDVLDRLSSTSLQDRELVRMHAPQPAPYVPKDVLDRISQPSNRIMRAQ